MMAHIYCWRSAAVFAIVITATVGGIVYVGQVL